MSKTPLQKYAIAVRKRDKWAKRAIALQEVIGGSALAPVAPIPTPVSAAELVASIPSSEPLLTPAEHRHLKPGGKYRGALERVAASSGVTLHYVYQVTSGRQQSHRLLRAVRAEFRRLDGLDKPKLEPLPTAVIKLFEAGEKYDGVFRAVGRKSRRPRSFYECVVQHPDVSPKDYAAILAGMARVDVEIAASQGGAR
jgi:hypothetical protein